VRAPSTPPILLGSGVTAENASRFKGADAAIGGTSLKVEDRVDGDRVVPLVTAFQVR
jgi:predicted TIM-barrel enzyme